MAKRMGGAARSAMLGAMAAVVVLAVAAGAGYLYLRQTGRLTKVERPSAVVVVFSSAAEDGAQVAQIVAVVGADGRGARFVEPETSATVPGTSYGTVRDAYPFGGAAAVARAVAGGSDVAWVDVPQKAWEELISGAGGARVRITQTMDVFDGSDLYTFREGTMTVAGDEIRALMNALAYVPARARVGMRDEVGRASLAALGAAGPAAGTAAGDGARETSATIATNLMPAAYAAVLGGLR